MIYCIQMYDYQLVETFSLPEEFDHLEARVIQCIHGLKGSPMHFRFLWSARESTTGQGFEFKPMHEIIALSSLFIEMKMKKAGKRSYPHPIFEGKCVTPKKKVWAETPHELMRYLMENCDSEGWPEIMKGELFMHWPDLYPEFESFRVPEAKVPAPRFDREIDI